MLVLDPQRRGCQPAGAGIAQGTMRLVFSVEKSRDLDER